MPQAGMTAGPGAGSWEWVVHTCRDLSTIAALASCCAHVVAYVIQEVQLRAVSGALTPHICASYVVWGAGCLAASHSLCCAQIAARKLQGTLLCGPAGVLLWPATYGVKLKTVINTWPDIK
jgi:hypothetical protein